MSPVRRRAKRATAPLAPTAEAAPVRPPDGIEGITSYRWVWYLLSLFVPFAGILVALFLYDQESWDVRKIGRNCLLIAFVVWILLPILVFLGMILIIAVAAAGVVSNAISPTD
jgi:hypothetical protein